MNNYQINQISKLFLLSSAFLIGVFSLWYTHVLVGKLEKQERNYIQTWAEANRIVHLPETTGNLNFYYEIIHSNYNIPVILADTSGNVILHRNIDERRMKDSKWVTSKIETMKKQNKQFQIDYLGHIGIIYYENSILLNQLRYYPYLQLTVIILFFIVSYFAFSYSRTSEQNKVWAGMSKETAHQLGTPISSMLGWIDYLREGDNNLPKRVVDELEKDIDRLNLITERFSKIGSEPVLEKANLWEVLNESIGYINSRTSDRVSISIKNENEFKQVNVAVNKPLFAWVIENLSKNAVDAMDGEGEIFFELIEHDNKVIFDVVDNGKGIASNKFKTIFKPGYTTKKRGWGLGLSLVKRIVENYHKGKIFVKHSEVGKGTRFRIELNTPKG